MIDKEKAFSNMAKAIAVYAVRHTMLENIHAGKPPVSKTGDFSDVYITDADGNKIAWADASRISQDEMKALMKQVVNSIYTFLNKMDTTQEYTDFLNYNLAFAQHWDEPELNKPFTPPESK